MPQATVKIAEYKAAHPNDRGKTVPPKMVDGNGTDYTIDRPVVDFISAHVGQLVEIEWTEKQNGQWTNRLIASAVEPKAPAKTGWQPKSPEERREIIRQTALKAAVDLFGSLYHGKGKESGLSTKPVLGTAEIFADWVQREHTLPEGPVEDIPW